MSKKEERIDDVIIVGAGIAGCVLAFHLANANLKVKVFEKKPREKLGHDWCDSIEKKAFTTAGIPPPKGEERKKERDYAAIISPDFGKIIQLGFYDYYITDRKLFQERLIKIAEKAGASFLFETEIVEPMGKGQWVIGVKKKDGKTENARLIVDCSGKERILGNNIEILDLNLPLEESELVEAYRETHNLDPTEINWNKYKIEKNIIYYRYGYEGGYSWLNFEDENSLDIGAGVGVGVSSRKATAIVNEFIHTNKQIQKEKIRGEGGRIVVRRPITLVWYGFMLCGEAACTVNPMTGFGVGKAMVSAKIAAEVISKALIQREVSIDKLWDYQVRFVKEVGRDLAALDMMRRAFQKLSEEEASYLLNRGIITKSDLEKMIHSKYPKSSILKLIISFFKGITNIKLMLKLRKAISLSNRIYKYYKTIPKEYDPRKYYVWLLGQMYIFKEIEENI
ncbi:MAG: NAD(P)/FAD-dependent oxidoreductase [Candidatus Heimdallarchaeota archaeon]